MARHLPLVILSLALVGLGLRVFEQDRRLARLREELDALRAATPAPSAAAPAPGATPFLRPARALPAAESPHDQPAEPAPSSVAKRSGPLRAAPLPREHVTEDELARVESAVLSLLDADRPELRNKLLEVVEEHQELTEIERQEQRRERWVARMEARLGELQGDAALSGDQREAIVNLLLANRDQIRDLRRNAETSEEFAEARATVRRLREEADAQVRELLTPAQYQAYRQLLDRDDDDRRDRRPPPAR